MRMCFAKTETFDGVMVANGHHAYPFMAEFEGLTKFKGRVTHSHTYKDDTGFRGRRIVVVGIGNSGGDIAVELSRVSSQIYLSTRTGCWCISRVGLFGLPYDLIMQNRFFNWFLQNTFSFVNTVVEFFINFNFDHDLYGLTCRQRVFGQHPFVNDDLPNRIASGTVIIKPNIKRFVGNDAVEFDDGTVVDKVDDLIMCTGYDVSFPLLENGIVEMNKNNEHNLYKMMYPTQLKHPTIAVVGLIQPWGAVMPISEMQARYHCEMMLKRVKLPEVSTMEQEIEEHRKTMVERYGGSRRHTVQVDYITYMDDLAKQFGAKPSVFGSILSDPLLAVKLMFAPAAPYQYRLHGPHCWPGAKDALYTVWDRSLAQMRMGRRVGKLEVTKRYRITENWNAIGFLALVVLVLAVFYIF